MSAINVSSLMAGAKRLAVNEWANTRAVGRGAMNLAQTRAPMMIGRAVRNMEMLNAYGRTAGRRGMASVVGSASWKAAAIGAGVGVAGSVTRDASQGNLNRGSFGRALGGGLMGGAVGGMVGAGNLMFRGNVNRAIRAQGRLAAGAPAAARVTRSGAMARARSAGMVGAMNGGGGVAVPPSMPVGVGVPVGSARSMNMSVMGGTVVAGRPSMGRVMSGAAGNRSAAEAARMRAANAAGVAGMMPNMDAGMTVLNNGVVNRNTLGGGRFGYTG